MRHQDWGKLVERQKNRAEHPGTPSISKEILDIYEEYITKILGKKKNPSCLVMGATPELRDFALKTKSKVVVVDLFPGQIKAMSNLMAYQDSPNETKIIADWLEMDKVLKKDSFDMIIGDACFANVRSEYWGRLAGNCCQLLKKDGRMLIRDLVYVPEHVKKSAARYVADYRSGIIKFPDLYVNLLFYSTDITTWDKKRPKVEYAIINKRMRNLYRKGVFDKNEYERLIKLVPPGTSRFFVPLKGFKRNLEKYFILLPVKQAKEFDFLGGTIPFFLGKPIKK
ncbi:MAG: class I SAM-dependent methyltransferase [Candidatus Staskawiczbacteria bacterium]|jgi:SAM-dependent methyltransferase